MVWKSWEVAVKSVKVRGQYLQVLVVLTCVSTACFYFLFHGVGVSVTAKQWLFGAGMILTYACLPLNLIELFTIRQTFERMGGANRLLGAYWVVIVLFAVGANCLSLLLRYGSHADYGWNYPLPVFAQCMLISMISIQAGLSGVEIPKIKSSRVSDNLAGTFALVILGTLVWFIYGCFTKNFVWPDLVAGVWALGWTTMLATTNETPGTAVTDATTIVEGTSTVEEAKEILGSRGVSVAQQEAAIGEVKKRQIASRIAMDHLISLGLSNPRDVIRCENAVRIQFGILNRKKIPISSTLAKQVGKWVMLQDYAPTLTRLLSDEGSNAMKVLETEEKGRVMEFLKLRFPDCIQREDVALLLASSPKIGDRLHMLLYLHDEHQKPKVAGSVVETKNL